MRVLIHAMPTKMGGAKRHLNNMVDALVRAESGHEFIVLINDEYDISVFDASVRTIRYPVAYSSGIDRIILDNREINRIVENERIDLLISFANIGPFKPRCRHILFEMNALYFCKNIRPLYTFKQRLDFLLKRMLIRLSARHADRIVTPSCSLRDRISEDLNIPKKRFEVLHHAMEREFCDAHGDPAFFSDDRVSFLYPSHLARHKGVHILLDALKIIKERNENVLDSFEVICTFDRSDEPRYYDELTEFIDRLGLDETVRFIGHQPQDTINTLYAGADYMIYTTLCESFGFSMLEAKVFRLPALCSDIPINREISKRSAFYYRWDDPADLADKLEFFVRSRPDDFDFEDELLEYNWEHYANKLLQIIEDVTHG
ncbi:glycosyltransferase family 4 protein [Hydrogenimonas sp.]